MQIIDVVHDAPEVRGAVHRDVDVSAPGEFNRNIGELRKNPQHPTPHRLRQARRQDGAVAHAPAKDHPVIAGQAEVVEHPLRVGDGCAARQQLRRSLGAERAAGRDERAHRHDA